jgi:hypothetical protein
MTHTCPTFLSYRSRPVIRAVPANWCPSPRAVGDKFTAWPASQLRVPHDPVTTRPTMGFFLPRRCIRSTTSKEVANESSSRRIAGRIPAGRRRDAPAGAGALLVERRFLALLAPASACVVVAAPLALSWLVSVLHDDFVIAVSMSGCRRRQNRFDSRKQLDAASTAGNIVAMSNAVWIDGAATTTAPIVGVSGGCAR